MSLYTVPAGEDSSRVGLGGTASGLRKGNVGGGDDGDGGLCRSVGVVLLGRDIVERRVDIPRR